MNVNIYSVILKICFQLFFILPFLLFLIFYEATNTLTCWTIFWLQVIANACKVPTTFVSELTESEDPDECVKHSDEDQELEQLISGEICFKVYPFSSGMV